jgi:hypothetical protein
MSGYAARTDVTVDRSIAEIERMLNRYGCEAYARGWQDTPEGRREILTFEANARRIRMTVTIPPISFFSRSSNGRVRPQAGTLAAWEQERRRRWRVLALVIKAKLEAVASGVVTFEDEFLAYTVLPNTVTMGDWYRQELDQLHGGMPPLLPSGH